MENEKLTKINVVVPKRGEPSDLYAGKRVLKREVFYDFVYQAFFYRGVKVVIGNITFSGRTCRTIKNKQVRDRVFFSHDKAASYLWYKAKENGSFQFHSQLEHLEYVIENN